MALSEEVGRRKSIGALILCENELVSKRHAGFFEHPTIGGTKVLFHEQAP
jgi:hypothetical protein